jgi:hypothetical protein
MRLGVSIKDVVAWPAKRPVVLRLCAVGTSSRFYEFIRIKVVVRPFGGTIAAVLASMIAGFPSLRLDAIVSRTIAASVAATVTPNLSRPG